MVHKSIIASTNLNVSNSELSILVEFVLVMMYVYNLFRSAHAHSGI